MSCWANLCACREGRLSYGTGRGPVTLVVPYVVDAETLLIPVAPFNEARQYVPGRQVTLEVTGRTEGRRWAVQVVGTAKGKLAHRVMPRAEVLELGVALAFCRQVGGTTEPLADVVGLALPAEQISGYETLVEPPRERRLVEHSW